MISNKETAARLVRFMARWLTNTMPGVFRVMVERDGRVRVKDALGWRDVGTVADWVPVARALGALS